MAVVYIPSLLRNLTGNIEKVNVPGKTVRDIIDTLEEMYPGIRDRLCDIENGGRVRPNIALIVDGVRSANGLRTTVNPDSEVHFVPAIQGGSVA